MNPLSSRCSPLTLKQFPWVSNLPKQNANFYFTQSYRLPYVFMLSLVIIRCLKFSVLLNCSLRILQKNNLYIKSCKNGRVTDIWNCSESRLQWLLSVILDNTQCFLQSRPCFHQCVYVYLCKMFSNPMRWRTLCKVMHSVGVTIWTHVELLGSPYS
jgi:hypothetical protein